LEGRGRGSEKNSLWGKVEGGEAERKIVGKLKKDCLIPVFKHHPGTREENAGKEKVAGRSQVWGKQSGKEEQT